MTAAVIPLNTLRPYVGCDITAERLKRLENIRTLMVAAARTHIGKGWELDTGIRLHSHYSVSKFANGPWQAIELWASIVEAELALDRCSHTFTGLDLAAIKNAITALRERTQTQI